MECTPTLCGFDAFVGYCGNAQMDYWYQGYSKGGRTQATNIDAAVADDIGHTPPNRLLVKA